MKHLIPFRIYESQMTSGVTEGQKEFLNKYTLGTWSVNPSTGLVDVQGNFNCSNRRLKSLLGISFGHVSGDFRCYQNRLTSLKGAPQTVVGGFYCNDNKLTSLEGAPQTVVGKFYCDLFEIQKGKWNMEGWMEVLNTGSEEAKKLILTLPVFQPEIWNSKLKEKPKATILQIVPIWDDLPKETQYGIQIPSNWKDGFDNLLDLQRAGIF